MYNFNPTQEPVKTALQVGDLVAVYGSLRKGKGNHSVLGESRYVETTTVQGVLLSLGGFPGLVQQAPNLSSGPVTVEIYEITRTEDGRYVDGLEGYSYNRDDNDFYVRSKIDTAAGYPVDIYYYQLDSVDEEWLERRHVSNGDWCSY